MSSAVPASVRSGEGGGAGPRAGEEVELALFSCEASERRFLWDSMQPGAHLHHRLLPRSGHL